MYAIPQPVENPFFSCQTTFPFFRRFAARILRHYLWQFRCHAVEKVNSMPRNNLQFSETGTPCHIDTLFLSTLCNSMYGNALAMFHFDTLAVSH
jgi:hypothetical protein